MGSRFLLKKESNVPQVRWVTITEDEAQQRLDNFLIRTLKGVPKSRIYRIVRKGEVRINKGRCKPQQRLQPGDVVRIPPVRVAEAAEIDLPIMALKRLEQQVIYEDDDLLLLNKPSGLAVHGGSGLKGGVIEVIRHLRPDQPFIELVHRLDRDTSGCLLLAKSRSALRQLHQQFRQDDQVEKRYQALLIGHWERKKQRVEVALRKNTLKGGERIVIVAKEGKPALTIFRRLRRFSDATLVEAELKTGRTHQIRVHAAWMGHPVAGDQRYGDDLANQQLRRRGLKRLFLHAAKLALTHPSSGERMVFEAPLDPRLDNFLASLEP